MQTTNSSDLHGPSSLEQEAWTPGMLAERDVPGDYVVLLREAVRKEVPHGALAKGLYSVLASYVPDETDGIPASLRAPDEVYGG